eukprot:gene38757-58241_t
MPNRFRACHLIHSILGFPVSNLIALARSILANAWDNGWFRCACCLEWGDSAESVDCLECDGLWCDHCATECVDWFQCDFCQWCYCGQCSDRHDINDFRDSIQRLLALAPAELWVIVLQFFAPWTHRNGVRAASSYVRLTNLAGLIASFRVSDSVHVVNNIFAAGIQRFTRMWHLRMAFRCGSLHRCEVCGGVWDDGHIFDDRATALCNCYNGMCDWCARDSRLVQVVTVPSDLLRIIFQFATLRGGLRLAVAFPKFREVYNERVDPKVTYLARRVSWGMMWQQIHRATEHDIGFDGLTRCFSCGVWDKDNAFCRWCNTPFCLECEHNENGAYSCHECGNETVCVTCGGEPGHCDWGYAYCFNCFHEACRSCGAHFGGAFVAWASRAERGGVYCDWCENGYCNDCDDGASEDHCKECHSTDGSGTDGDSGYGWGDAIHLPTGDDDDSDGCVSVPVRCSDAGAGAAAPPPAPPLPAAYMSWAVRRSNAAELLYKLTLMRRAFSSAVQNAWDHVGRCGRCRGLFLREYNDKVDHNGFTCHQCGDDVCHGCSAERRNTTWGGPAFVVSICDRHVHGLRDLFNIDDIAFSDVRILYRLPDHAAYTMRTGITSLRRSCGQWLAAWLSVVRVISSLAQNASDTIGRCSRCLALFLWDDGGFHCENCEHGNICHGCSAEHRRSTGVYDFSLCDDHVHDWDVEAGNVSECNQCGEEVNTYTGEGFNCENCGGTICISCNGGGGYTGHGGGPLCRLCRPADYGDSVDGGSDHDDDDNGGDGDDGGAAQGRASVSPPPTPPSPPSTPPSDYTECDFFRDIAAALAAMCYDELLDLSESLGYTPNFGFDDVHEARQSMLAWVMTANVTSILARIVDGLPQ